MSDPKHSGRPRGAPAFLCPICYYGAMSSRPFIFLGVALVALQAGILFFLGQPAICACGYVKVWEGVVLSSGNSQHLLDWYTFSHVIHGIIFFLALRWIFPRLSTQILLAISIGIEVAWEVLENTPMVINHYRQQALAQGYTGDSVINSVSDTLAMVLGFFAAWRLPMWVVIVAALLFEAFTFYMIHDGLALNILGLIAPGALRGLNIQ